MNSDLFKPGSAEPWPLIRVLAANLSSASVTSSELVAESLNRIDSADPSVFTCVFAEAALQSAQTIDLARQKGTETRPFAGIPISIKDLFDLEGVETWAGSRVLQGRGAAAKTASAIELLVEAGFIIIGKTNMTEFAYSGLGLNPHFGTPANPCDPIVKRIPGGSSSGSAVSVAGGMVAAGIGTDTGGSVRIPASLCGLTGFKPGSSTVAQDGVIPLARSLDCIGPMANSVQCCADLYSVLTGHGQATKLLDARPLSTLRILVPDNIVWEDCDAESVACVAEVVDILRKAGAFIEHRYLSLFDEVLASGVQGSIAAYEAWQWHEPLLVEHREQYDPRVGGRIQMGAEVSRSRYEHALGARMDLQKRFALLMNEFDVILYPTTAIQAPSIDAFADDDEYSRLNFLMLRNTAIGNVLDASAVSLPVPLFEEGQPSPGKLPVGVMVMGPQGSDLEVLEIAHTIEKLLADQVG